MLADGISSYVAFMSRALDEGAEDPDYILMCAETAETELSHLETWLSEFSSYDWHEVTDPVRSEIDALVMRARR